MTGYRIGSVIGGEKLLGAIEKILECVTICPSRVGQEAALFAVENLAEWRTQEARMMAERLATCTLIAWPTGWPIGPKQEPYLRFAFANLATEQIPKPVQRLIDSQD